MKIVVDTNVLIAALTKPKGASARILRAWRDGRLDIVSSEATLREAELILSGAWLERLVSRDEVKALLRELRSRSIRVRGRPIAGLGLRDEGDVRLVEAAVDGEAGYLVTADREVLLQRGHGAAKFVTPGELLRALGQARGG